MSSHRAAGRDRGAARAPKISGAPAGPASSAAVETATSVLAVLALAISLVAVTLSASAWLSFLGAPLGGLSLLMGAMAVWLRRRRGRRSLTGLLAVVLSGLAVALLPFYLWACGSWLSCA